MMNDNSDLNGRRAWFDIQLQNGISLLENRTTIQAASFKATIDYSKAAIRGAFILNGSAAVAILYNLDKIKDWKCLVIWCAAGALFSVLCAGFSYIAQGQYLRSDLNNYNREITNYFSMLNAAIRNERISCPQTTWTTSIYATLFSFIAIIFWIISLFCFGYAVYTTLVGISSP